MDSPSDSLILPFNKIWLDLAAQSNSWTTVHKLILNAIELPACLENIATQLNSRLAGEECAALLAIKGSAKQLATEAKDVLLSRQNPMVYPSLVGTWAIVESSFDQLIKKILMTDPGVPERLRAYGVKQSLEHSNLSAAWADEMYGRVEKRAKQINKGSLVAIHKSIFSAVGITFEYGDDNSRVIEELNQVRNCILHNQGVIDAKAADCCPRLEKYVGSSIPSSDPIFAIAAHMISDYTLAWVAGLLHGPMLSSGLKVGVKNPFAA